MIYRNYKINAQVDTWDIYELNDDGTLGGYIGDGGGDTEYPMYAVWELDAEGDETESLDEYSTLAEAKMAIDQAIKEATTFQSEAGN